MLNSDGSYTFDASHGDYNSLAVGATAIETINYIVDDGQGGSAAGVLEITVTGTNDAPTANADAWSVSEDAAGTFDVVANDTDPDIGDTLSTSNGGGTLGGFLYPVGPHIVGFDPNGYF